MTGSAAFGEDVGLKYEQVRIEFQNKRLNAVIQSEALIII